MSTCAPGKRVLYILVFFTGFFFWIWLVRVFMHTWSEMAAAPPALFPHLFFFFFGISGFVFVFGPRNIHIHLLSFQSQAG